MEGVLGSGGHATVYQVRHVDLGVVRALKVLHTADVVLRSRLLTEGRILAQLDHPNVVGVYDVFSLEGSPALVMEFVGGGSLQALVDKGALDFIEARRLFVETCAGVAAAHDAGVVHRDLKPANVLLDDNQRPARPKVADFGIARAPDLDKGHRTRAQQGLGSPAFMAPEQGRDAASVDVRADIWSLGACLYALLAGRPPFAGDAWWEVMAVAASGRYAPLSTVRPGTPVELERVVDACLRVDPRERPPSVATLLGIVAGDAWTAPVANGAASTMDWDSDEAGQAPAAHAEAPRSDPEPGPPTSVGRREGELSQRGSAPVDSATPPREGGIGVAHALVVDGTGRGHVVEVLVSLAAGDGTVWSPTDAQRDTVVAAQTAVAAALGGQLGGLRVTWQVRGSGVRLEGTSLGLALAVAAYSAMRRRPPPRGWCYTGGVDIDGRVVGVGGISAKLVAARGAGLGHAVVPATGSPPTTPDGLAVVETQRLSAVLSMLFQPTRGERLRVNGARAAAFLLATTLGLAQLGALVDSRLQYPILRAAGRGLEVEQVVLVELPPVDDTRSLRATYGPLLRRLQAAGARAALLDLTMTAESPHDADLAGIIEEVSTAGMPVIVPGRVDGEMLSLPSTPALARAAGLGHAISLRDLSIGWVRRAQLQFHDVTGETWWHVSALAAAAAVGGAPPEIRGDELVLGPLRVSTSQGSFALPPAGEVARVRSDGELTTLAGKVAVVGVVREGVDIHATADGTRHGPEILAIEIQTLLRQAAPRTAPAEVEAASAGAAALATMLARRRWVPVVVAAAALLVGVLLAAGGVLVSVSAPLLGGLLGLAASRVR